MTKQDFIDRINENPQDRELQKLYANWLSETNKPLSDSWWKLIKAGYQPKQEHDGTWTWTYPFDPIDEAKTPRSFYRYRTYFHAMQAVAVALEMECENSPV